jgi:hypothetical protein
MAFLLGRASWAISIYLSDRELLRFKEPLLSVFHVSGWLAVDTFKEKGLYLLQNPRTLLKIMVKCFTLVRKETCVERTGYRI